MHSHADFPGSARYTPISARQGGMGLVFFCIDKETESHVALKTLRPEFSSQGHAHLRFLNEACEWIYLGKHPNIVRALRVESLGNPARPFLVLEGISPPGSAEFGADVSLRALIKAQSKFALSFERSLRITLDVCSAMAHATQKIPGLVHRDIKPENILLDRFGVAKLSDFGIARSFEEIDEDQSPLTIPTEQISVEEFKPAGSPFYVAPEIWTPGAVADERADIYALGLCLFEMITGRKRVSGNSFAALRQKHTSGSVLKIPEQVPDELKGLIDSSCALSPEDRPQDWPSMLALLRSCYQAVTGNTIIPPAEESLTATETEESHVHSYLTISDSYRNLGYSDVALRYAELAVETANKNMLDTLEIDSLNRKTHLLISLGNTDQANETNRASTILANQGSDVERQIDCLILQSSLLAESASYPEAISILKLALDKAAALESMQTADAISANLGNVYAKSGDIDQAIRIYEQQLARFEANKDTSNRIVCLLNLGTACLESGAYEKADYYYRECLELADESADWQNLASAYKSMAMNYELQNKIDNAVSITMTLRKQAEQWADKEILEFTHNELKRLLQN